MNFFASAFKRNIGPQPSVESIAVDGQNVVTSNHNDRVNIRSGAFNRGGYAEATGLNNSTVSTLAGDDAVRIQANARGLSTNAWAMRNSSLDVGDGNDKVDLRASTRAGAFDPAYGAEDSTIVLGNGQDSLRINAHARGNTTDTIAAFGTLNSITNTGADNDRVEIRTTANNRRGIAEAAALDKSSLETEGGDDLVRIKAGAYGQDTQAWGLRDSEANTGSGQDNLRINAHARGNTTDTVGAYGTLNSLTNTGADNDRIDIRATASNRGGTAEAVGLDASDLATEGGDDRIRIQAHANGEYTYAWALRDSSLDAGSGTNSINLSASTIALGVDPAYGMDNSSIVAGADQDNLRINAHARGNTAGITGSGDDLIRISAHANGLNREAWAMRNSSLDAGAGDNNIEINGNVLRSKIRTGSGVDTIRLSGLETDQMQIDSGANDDVLKVDGGTRISYTSGDGSDQLHLTSNYFTSLIQANEINQELSQVDRLIENDSNSKEQNQDINKPLQFAESPTGLNLRDALKFEDFTTGVGGDSVNIDGILRGYGVGLKRESIFADGFLSFEQKGDDSVLVFDADGTDQQAKSDMALVVFKGVHASAFSTDNLDSVLINQDDFLLNQEQQKTTQGDGVGSPFNNEGSMSNIDVDPITGIGAGQPITNGTIETTSTPFTHSSGNAQSVEVETSQPLNSTSLDLATSGLEAPVTFSPLPELEAGPTLSTPVLDTSTDIFTPVSASTSFSGQDANLAASSAALQTPTDLV